jgi:hypothetical protein
MKKLLSFFLSLLKVLRKVTLAMGSSIIVILIRVARASLLTVLPRAMLLMCELVPCKSGA